MIQHFLESLSGMNGSAIMALAGVALTAYAIAAPLRYYIHRFTPHTIDAERVERDIDNSNN